MWHEARRQERKIRGMLVDYRRRAERRRDFYEKIKADPTQFLQLHGRPCKIHLDSAIATAADSPATMMPWQGHSENLIDRFDVRAHLDFIPTVTSKTEEEPSYEERQCNYERYRILAQNAFLGMNEEKFLKQLHLEEQFGYTAEADKDKKRKNTGAAIGFNYDDPSATKDLVIKNDNSDDDDDDESDSDLDVDLCIDVSKVEQSQAHEMNKCGQQFGMCSNDFYSFLTNDMEEAENIRLAREEEHEKALFSGRKSRRERRAHREKRLANRVLSPPSYAARDSPTYPAFRESKSRSRSPTPVNTGQITYITSFGDDEEPSPSTSKPTYADKVRYGKRKTSDNERNFNSRYDKVKRADRDKRYRRRSRSRSRSRSRGRYYRQKRTRSRSRSRSANRRRKSRSRCYTSFSRSCSRSRRSRNRSRDRKSRTVSSSSSSSSSSKSSNNSQSKSRSKSPSSASSKNSVKEEPPKPVQRYYGRRVSDKSSSEIGDSTDEETTTQVLNPASADKVSVFGNSGAAVKPVVSNAMKMTPQERLKRKMQVLLNRQYKADKKAEQIRTERAQQEQRNREDELREMALKLRRRQRERRHAYDDNSNPSSDSESSSSRDHPASESHSRRSPSPPSPKRRSRDEEKSRGKDKSPHRSRTEYKRNERSCTPPEKKDDEELRKNKHKSLVDY